MNKNNLLYLLIGGIVVFAALIWLGSTETSQPTPVSDAYVTQPPALSDVFYENYMEGCNEDGDLYQYCNCTWDYLTDNYSIDELLWLDENLDSQETDRIVGEALNACQSVTY